MSTDVEGKSVGGMIGEEVGECDEVGKDEVEGNDEGAHPS